MEPKEPFELIETIIDGYEDTDGARWCFAKFKVKDANGEDWEIQSKNYSVEDAQLCKSEARECALRIKAGEHPEEAVQKIRYPW